MRTQHSVSGPLGLGFPRMGKDNQSSGQGGREQHKKSQSHPEVLLKQTAISRLQASSRATCTWLGPRKRIWKCLPHHTLDHGKGLGALRSTGVFLSINNRHTDEFPPCSVTFAP